MYVLQTYTARKNWWSCIQRDPTPPPVEEDIIVAVDVGDYEEEEVPLTTPAAEEAIEDLVAALDDMPL